MSLFWDTMGNAGNWGVIFDDLLTICWPNIRPENDPGPGIFSLLRLENVDWLTFLRPYLEPTHFILIFITCGVKPRPSFLGAKTPNGFFSGILCEESHRKSPSQHYSRPGRHLSRAPDCRQFDRRKAPLKITLLSLPRNRVPAIANSRPWLQTRTIGARWFRCLPIINPGQKNFTINREKIDKDNCDVSLHAWMIGGKSKRTY